MNLKGEEVAKHLIALEETPTDLRPYSQGQILPINTPTPGKFIEVSGADAGEKHSFRTIFEADANNPAQAQWQVGTDLNYGYSSFGDVFGQLFTADGGKPFSASDTPIMRMEIEQEVATRTPNVGGRIDFSFNTTYTLLIRKTDLATAPATIFARYYSGVPGTDNQVATIEFMKGSDNPLHLYHTYIDRSGADISEEDLLSITYFNLFTSSPATGDQTSNPLELHENKGTMDFSVLPASWARAGQPVPTGTFSFNEDEADSDKSLKVLVEETTPAMSGGSPVAGPSNILFAVTGSDFVFNRSFGSTATPDNTNLSSLFFRSLNNRYEPQFLKSFTGQKLPLTIEIGGTSYNLSYNSQTSTNIIFRSTTIPSNDRVTASSLTKAINFELVDNGLWTVSSVNPAPSTITGSSAIVNNVSLDVYWSTNTARLGSFQNTWQIRNYSGKPHSEKQFTHLVVNGREYPLNFNRSYSNQYFTSRITDTGFFPTAIGQSFGLNLKKSDGTYYFNTRSHLFQTVPGATPESKAPKVLTQAGALDWLQTGIDADIEAKVPQQFRTDATTSTTRFQPKCFEMGTSAQITAITPKVENCFYITLKTGQ